MNFFIILAKENLPKFLVIILLSIVSGIFSGLIIIFALNGIEDIVVGQNYLMYVLLIPITAIIIFISTRFAQLESAFLSENIQEKLILKISNNFRRAKLETIERKNLTDIYRQILNAQTITNSITKYINMFQSIITIFILWVYIYIISVIMGLILLIFFFFVILVYELYQKLLEPIIVEQLTHETEMYSQISSILNGLKELKLDPSKNDDLFNNYLKNEIIETKNLKSSMLFSHVQYYLFINTGFFVMLGITGFILTSFFHPSIIMKVLTIIIFIWTPTLTIVDAIPYVLDGQTALKQLFLLADEFGEYGHEEEPVYSPFNQTIKRFNKIILHNLTFKYKQMDQSLDFSIGPFNVEINSGEIVFITGGNGSGKTTLIKLLTGLYQLESGEIWIDEKRVNMGHHKYLFNAIFSDYYIFEKLYGLDDIDENKIYELLSLMDLNNKVQWINHKFSTTNLSTGQRKRLALLVTLLENRPIYIFDEWASDQDAHFRHFFYESLLPSFKKQGKTIIAVTHDDAFFHVADKLIRLDYGQII